MSETAAARLVANLRNASKSSSEKRGISMATNVIGGGREGKTNLSRFFVGWPVFRLS